MHFSARARRWSIRLLKLSIAVLVIWSVRKTAITALSHAREHEFNWYPSWLFAAGVLYLVGLFPSAVLFHRLMRWQGQRPKLFDSIAAYYFGQLGKYVPGKAMVVVIRAGMVRGPETSLAVATAAVFYETATLVTVDVAVAAVLSNLLEPKAQPRGLVLAAAATAATVLLTPAVFRRLVGLVGWASADVHTLRQWRLPAELWFVFWPANMLGCLLFGASLWCVLRGLGVDEIGLSHVFTTTLATSVAMAVGFVALLPGGAVVREGVMMELLSHHVGDANALVASLLLRLVWILSECALAAMLVIGRGWPRPAIPPPEVQPFP